jgi:hypothetical protein
MVEVYTYPRKGNCFEKVNKGHMPKSLYGICTFPLFCIACGYDGLIQIMVSNY